MQQQLNEVAQTTIDEALGDLSENERDMVCDLLATVKERLSRFLLDTAEPLTEAVSKTQAAT